MISAAVIRALDGDMQARLLPRHEVKGDSAENRRIGEQELARCREMGIEAGQVLRMDQMARNDNVISPPPASPRAICWRASAAVATWPRPKPC